MRYLKFTDKWISSVIFNEFIFLTNNSLSREELNYCSGCRKNIHYGDILTKYLTVKNVEDSDVPFINDKVRNSCNAIKLQTGDIVIADTAEDYTTGKAIEIININSLEVYSGLHTIPLRPNKVFARGYLAYYFNSQAFKKRIFPLIQGIKVYSISKTALSSTNIKFPEIAEQKKIANLLVNIDNRINTQRKIIEDLETQKKSIINKIYGNILYNCKLSEIITQVSIRNKNNDIDNVLSVSNKYGFIKQSEQFEDREVASDDVTNYKIVEKDIFAYNPARINVGSIAKYNCNEKGIISPMYICFRTNSQLCPEYLNYYFLSSSFKKQMAKRLEGSVRQCLTYESLANIPFCLPSMENQKKNATIIAAFNNKINLESNYLKLLENQKAYLLEKMFI